ncbi:MAG: GerMN domain-containing protein [Christensenellales bacterium]|jgi:germination protein M
MWIRKCCLPFLPLLLALCLWGCAAAPLAAETVPPAAEIAPSAAEALPPVDTDQAVPAALYYPNAAGSQLVRRTAEVIVEEGQWKAVPLLRRLLEENPGDDQLSLLFRGRARLAGVSKGGDLAVVNLRVDTGLLTDHELFNSVIALTNTLTENLGVTHVSILLNGGRMTPSGLLTNPMTRQTQPLDVLWILQQAILSGQAVPSGITTRSPLVLFFQDTTGKYLMPEVQEYTGDGANPALDTLVGLLRGPANTSRLVSVAGNVTITPSPEAERIPGSNGVRIKVWLVSARASSLDSSALKMLCGAVTLSLFHSVDRVSSVAIFLDGNPVISYQGARISTSGEFTREDFSRLLGEPMQLYFPDRNGTALVGVSRAMAQSEVWSPEACVRALVEGPMKGDSASVTYAFPVDATQADVLGVYVAESCAYVNVSAAFAAACRGMEVARERLMLYSVVNSLTEMDNINRVQFLVDGAAVSELGGNFNLSRPLWRNPGLIQN